LEEVGSIVDILEQLQDKIQHTIQAIENLQLENMQLQEDLDTVRNQLASKEQELLIKEQELNSMREQNNQLNQEQTRLNNEHHEFEARVMSLVQTLESAVTETTPQPVNPTAPMNDGYQPQPVDNNFVQPDGFVPQNNFV
jgi:chromosome segregation ATPase